uniref:Bifunctional inhibitor/plant lipid transfer protein/seed storage helical domain-containing protein n=1 Tax=Oryza rufipogon TaxID=4529 RepID=A0A0E0R3S5_ORYRU
MISAKVIGVFCVLAFLAISSSPSHLQAEGCENEKNIVMNKDGCYHNIERHMGDQFPKRHSHCCQTVESADINCICRTFTAADKAKIALSKWVNVAKECGNPLHAGTNCAGYRVPLLP